LFRGATRFIVCRQSIFAVLYLSEKLEVAAAKALSLLNKYVSMALCADLLITNYKEATTESAIVLLFTVLHDCWASRDLIRCHQVSLSVLHLK
jgi:hypothetical protein